MRPDLVIYPASLLNPKRAEEHFEAEWSRLAERPVLHDADEGVLRAGGRDLSGATLLYRGWILTPVQYLALSELVERAGARLYVGAEGYERSQFGRDWFTAAGTLTPATEVLPYGVSHDEALDAFERVAGSGNEDGPGDEAGTGSAVLKGVSKSLKHEWEDAMFVRDRGDLLRVLGNFRARVASDEEPHLLLRAFESWVPGELRVFWAAGPRGAEVGTAVAGASAAAGRTDAGPMLPVQIAPHPQSPVDVPRDGLDEFLRALRPVVEGLGAGLVTTDLARDAGGVWRLVEIGNGQVSEPAVPFAEVALAAGWVGLYDCSWL